MVAYMGPSGSGTEFGGDPGGVGGLMAANPTLGGVPGTAAGAHMAADPWAAGETSIPFQGQQTSIAGSLGLAAGQMWNTGSMLIDPLLSGRLQPGAEQMVQNQLKQARNTVQGRYANLGQTGSTMEGDALAQLENQTTEMRFKIAEQEAQLGLQATAQSLQALGMESGIYNNMMQAQMKKDDKMSGLLGGFAGGLGKMFGSMDFGKMFSGIGSLFGGGAAAGEAAGAEGAGAGAMEAIEMLGMAAI